MAHQQSELHGTREFNSIASGPAAQWWKRGRFIAAANGNFTGSLTDNAGQPDPVSGGLGISPAGVAKFPGSGTGRGVPDACKSARVMTSTWTGFAAGAVDMTVGAKMAAAYTLADLVGVWEVNALATGPGDQGERSDHGCAER